MICFVCDTISLDKAETALFRVTFHCSSEPVLLPPAEQWLGPKPPDHRLDMLDVNEVANYLYSPCGTGRTEEECKVALLNPFSENNLSQIAEHFSARQLIEIILDSQFQEYYCDLLPCVYTWAIFWQTGWPHSPGDRFCTVFLELTRPPSLGLSLLGTYWPLPLGCHSAVDWHCWRWSNSELSYYDPVYRQEPIY